MSTELKTAFLAAVGASVLDAALPRLVARDSYFEAALSSALETARASRRTKREMIGRDRALAARGAAGSRAAPRFSAKEYMREHWGERLTTGLFAVEDARRKAQRTRAKLAEGLEVEAGDEPLPPVDLSTLEGSAFFLLDYLLSRGPSGG